MEELIGIVGFRGRLGSELLRQLGTKAEGIECDIRDVDSIKAALSGKEYDAIVNCAAYNDIEAAQRNSILAYAINTTGPHNLANVYKGYIIHFSSDYIFDGLSGPYEEDIPATPINSYGFSKYMGEVGLKSSSDRVLIIRTTLLYNADPDNFVLSVYNKLKDNKYAKVPRELIGNPTYVPHLAHGVIFCLEHKITGIVNISGKSRLSRYQSAREIALMFGFDTTKIVHSFTWGEVKRPQKAGFVLERAKVLGIPLYSYWEGLDALKTELEREKNERQ